MIKQDAANMPQKQQPLKKPTKPRVAPYKGGGSAQRATTPEPRLPIDFVAPLKGYKIPIRSRNCSKMDEGGSNSASTVN